MTLEIRHNKASHTHENFQFRRVAIKLKDLFEKKGWNGLFIGNPETEYFSRFRADAILLYDHGLVVIDFKDYRGAIYLPNTDEEFSSSKWYNETNSDNQRIVIKGGSFINPFRQLESYKSVMYDVISSNKILETNLDPSHTFLLNIFSGPIKLNKDTPRSKPYYRICQESDLNSFLYDYSSKNTFSDETAKILKVIFPTEEWDDKIDVLERPDEQTRVYEIEADLKSELRSFLKEDSSGILILKSMESALRDEWVNYIQFIVAEFDLPQIEAWTHSSRIRGRINKRSGVATDSLYSAIYGGKAKPEDREYISDGKGKETKEVEETAKNSQEIVPIRSDEFLDENALVILHEAHLVTKSMHQSELLRFGSGRLLEDLIEFLDLENTKRKLICIGDPYSLSYGKEEESALNIDTLEEKFHGKIKHYRKEQGQKKISFGIQRTRMDLASSIDKCMFNNLKYSLEGKSLIHIERAEALDIWREWYSKPVLTEPDTSILVYKNKDAKKINLWIKDNCLKNTEQISEGDLLIIHSNVNIHDPTGFGQTTKLHNGMYLVVKSRIGENTEPIFISEKRSVKLHYIKLKVQCLSFPGHIETEVWLLENFFISDAADLSKDEHIALRILFDKKVKEQKEKTPFKSSEKYEQFKQDSEFVSKSKDREQLKKLYERGEKVKVKLEKANIELNKLQRKYEKEYNYLIQRHVMDNDILINAIHATYGWAITVHKAVGSQFSEICLNADQGENRGIDNENYFRWLYSGLTAASDQAYVANLKEINPLSDCQIKDTVREIRLDALIKLKRLPLVINDEVVPARFVNKMNNDLSTNTKLVISRLASILGEHGILLNHTERIGGYHSKGFFSLQAQNAEFLIISFYNNDKGAITSIRPEKTEQVNAETINDCITKLWKSQSLREKTENLDWPNDFRKYEYESWSEKCLTNGGSLRLIESHNYRDVFIAEKNKNKIRFEVIYNTKGFFTHINVLEKTNLDTQIVQKNSHLIVQWPAKETLQNGQNHF